MPKFDGPVRDIYHCKSCGMDGSPHEEKDLVGVALVCGSCSSPRILPIEDFEKEYAEEQCLEGRQPDSKYL